MVSLSYSIYLLDWLLNISRTISSRAFQRSLWPFILRSDSSQTHGARTSILLVTNLLTWVSILIALAGIITPLGLYDALVPTNSVQITFQYLKDETPFGRGTPLRSNLPFSRYCDPVCPFSSTLVIDVEDSRGDFNSTLPYGYNLSIPQFIMDVYSSGTTQPTTVSNFFDIQWRRYFTSSAPEYNNGSSYLISEFRNMQSLVKNIEVQLVEGLVVDMVNGSVGFRNHTFPPDFQYAVTWSEDLLFVEPETVCVDTNLTIDYTIAKYANSTTSLATNIVLTDRGGFVDLRDAFPAANMTDPQSNPDLWTRAYVAAWYNNFYSALYWNITDLSNTYVDSAVNKTFQLPDVQDFTNGESYLAVKATQEFGDFTGAWAGQTEVLNLTNPAGSQPIPNPYNISGSNYELIQGKFHFQGSNSHVSDLPTKTSTAREMA
jgi:hypothetical protein